VSVITRELGSVENWQLVYDQFFYAQPAPEVNPNAYHPIPDAQIPFLFDRHVLAIATSSTKVKPRWYLAGRLIQQISALGTDFIDAQANRINLQLNRTQLVVLPQLSSTYKLRVEIPWWHEEMGLTIWEYTGPEEDSTEEIIQTLKVDVARLEYRILSFTE